VCRWRDVGLQRRYSSDVKDAAALERAVLLLGQTVAASSMQAVTTTMVGEQIGAPTTQSSLDDVTLEWNKPKEEDEGPEFESWRMKLVFQLNTNISRSDWRLCPIGQHLVNLIVDKQFDTCLWCLIVNSTAIRP
jgi:hypothetical protein